MHGSGCIDQQGFHGTINLFGLRCARQLEHLNVNMKTGCSGSSLVGCLPVKCLPTAHRCRKGG